MKALLDEPLKGEMKKGALKGVRVVKFKADDRQYLLAYYFFPKPNVIEILDVGVHENFSRGLEATWRIDPQGNADAWIAQAGKVGPRVLGQSGEPSDRDGPLT